MDPNEYLPMFIAECREHLQELNVAIVALERNPDDAAGVDAIFRVVHSVKGMAGTMGFDGMARLTHEMEEVFELVRQRHGAVSHETIDVVLECLDELATALDAVEHEGKERIDPEPLIPRLRALVRAPAAAADSASAPVARTQLPDDDAGLTVLVSFAEDTQMRAVLAYMLLCELRNHGMLLASVPSEEELETWTGSSVELICTANVTFDELAAVAKDVEGVVDVSLCAPDGDREPEAPSEAEPADLELESDDLAQPPEPDDVEQPAEKVTATEVEEPLSARHIARSRTVRVDAERLDQLMHYMGELVVHRTQLASLVAQAEVPGIAQAMQELERSSQALRAMVMKVRMIEVEAVFVRLPRLVRDLAGKLGKEVELSVSGGDTELDRTVVDALGDPLVHLVRNAIDHGIEPAEARIAVGKPAAAALTVSARQGGGGVIISVRDDGCGIDAAKVQAKARERGLSAADEELTTEQAVEMLFRPGFSTALEATDISGRGVGLDAARNAVRALGGDVVLSSSPGTGTLAEIRLPLTLAITSALVVEIAGLPFAIPLDRIDWTLALDDQNVRMAAGQAMLVLPDGVVPLCDGAQLLAGCAAETPPEHAVIVRCGDALLGITVGELVGQRELVTRPLPRELELNRPVSAGAVLSEGAIALIVDCDALSSAFEKEVHSHAIAA